MSEKEMFYFTFVSKEKIPCFFLLKITPTYTWPQLSLVETLQFHFTHTV